jgi:cytochrome c biogenesis protein CcmG/thiol:disulfide interchange protein DsbE
MCITPRRRAALLAVVALVVAACGGATTAGSPGASVVTIGSPLIGKAAPALVGTTLDGAPFDLASLKGSPVIVNFWSSWCGPCRDEFPLLGDVATRHAGDGLVVLEEGPHDDADPARNFVAQQGASWRTVTDPDRAIGGAWKVLAPPQTFFVDREGVVREVQVGQIRDAAELDQLLGSILP